MKKYFTILLFFCAGLSDSKACLNYFYGVDRTGHLHLAEDIREHFNLNFNKKRNADQLRKLKKSLDKQSSYMLLSDYSVTLMKLGKHKEALEILQTLYIHHPNEYRIASNLGTAYELNGDPLSALKFIRRGLVLNPNDHEGSEWIHVKVLEAKLAMQKDPSWLQSHTVLQLSSEQERDSAVCRHIAIQVRERFPFSPRPDMIMAGLLTDLGDCYANVASVEYARAVYEIACEYYGDNSADLQKKIADMKKLAKEYLSVQPANPYVNNRYIKEGEHNKVSAYFSYKQLLDDNDKEHYRVDWTTLVSEPRILLRLAGLNESAEVIDSILEAGQESPVRDTAKSSVVGVSLPHANVYNHVPWYAWAFTIVGATGIVWLIARWLNRHRSGRDAQAAK